MLAVARWIAELLNLFTKWQLLMYMKVWCIMDSHQCNRVNSLGFFLTEFIHGHNFIYLWIMIQRVFRKIRFQVPWKHRITRSIVTMCTVLYHKWNNSLLVRKKITWIMYKPWHITNNVCRLSLLKTNKHI